MTAASKRARRRVEAPKSPPAADAAADDWREATLADLRAILRRTAPELIEEVKWRKPSHPEGVPVWSHEGIVCIGNVLKLAVRLTFPDGARLEDPRKLFNTRLDSRTVRAVDFFEGVRVDEVALTGVLRDALRINEEDARARTARGPSGATRRGPPRKAGGRSGGRRRPRGLRDRSSK